MSDYLGHLAARSLDPAATAVRPRLASWFEPPSPAVPPLWEETMVVTPEPPWAQRSSTLAEKKEPLQSPTAMTTTSQRRSARREGAPVEEAEQEAPGHEIRSPEPLELDSWRRPSPHLPGPSSPLSPGGRGGGWEREGWESEGPRRRRSSVQIESLASQPSPKVLVAEPSSPPQRDSVVRTPVKAKPDAAPFLQPRVTIVERGPFSARREEPAPAPIIQVTIGRIEVRATPAPAQPPRQRPAAPSALSLEDYLRQRSKGGQG